MPDFNRRRFLHQGSLLCAGALPLALQARSLDFLADDKQLQKGLSNAQRFKLSKAVLDVLQSHYGNMTLQFWNKPFAEIEFEKRITNIVYWVDKATQQTRSPYAVDPIWVMAQIMAESLFCEMAISKSMAVGICQFMPNTATQDFNMIIGGSLPAHHKAPYVALEKSDALNRYSTLIKEKSAYRKASADEATLNLNTALKALASGKDAQQQAEAQLKRQQQLQEFDQKIRQAKQDYVEYLRSNVAILGDDDIFKNTEFFTGFDERFTYNKPIHAMVNMLANALRVRSGNMLTAAAAYNAGLSRTWTNEALYTQYGKLPNISETAQYLSRIVANYEEISARYLA